MDIDRSPDAAALASRAAAWMLSVFPPREMFGVALAGGNTPRLLYQCLAGSGMRDSVPWPRIHWFWGDERFVPQTDERSNFGMARDAMLAHAPVPPENIHTIRTDGHSPAESAAAYEHALRAWYGADRLDPARPLFEVTLLGLGEDGHTASLFPKKPALGETECWVTATSDPDGAPRITLTYPALLSSRHVAFLVSGPAKRSALRALIAGDPGLPASRVHGLRTTMVFADEPATSA